VMKNKLKVLIVEDEFLVATFLSRNLEQFFEYEICGSATTGEEAILQYSHYLCNRLFDVRVHRAESRIGTGGFSGKTVGTPWG